MRSAQRVTRECVSGDLESIPYDRRDPGDLLARDRWITTVAQHRHTSYRRRHYVSYGDGGLADSRQHGIEGRDGEVWAQQLTGAGRIEVQRSDIAG